MLSIEQKTSEYLSKLRLVSTLLVVMVHSENLLGYASYNQYNPLISFFDVFAAAGVPLFFAVSGYLLFSRKVSYKENIKKKVRTLLIPFLFWNSLWMLTDFIGSLVLPAYFSSLSISTPLQFLKSFFGIPFSDSPYYVPLWFVRDLFFLNLAAPLFTWLTEKIPAWLNATLCACLFLLLPHGVWYKFGQGFSFFLLGSVTAKIEIKFPNRKTSKILAVVCTALVLVSSFVPTLGREGYLWRLALLAAITAVCSVLSIVKVPALNKLLPFSFPVYVLHGKILSAMQILYSQLTSCTTLAVCAGYFVLPAAVIAVCVFISTIFKRLLSKMYSRVMGSR